MSKRYPFIRVVLLICLLLYLLLAHCKTSNENLIPLFFKGNSGAETCTENSIDTFANVSPDGKWLFFVSGRNGNVVIYWVDAKVMNKLKMKDLK